MTGVVTLPAGTEMVMPGDSVTVDVELITPIAMEEKLRFAIREGSPHRRRRRRGEDYGVEGQRGGARRIAGASSFRG